VCARCQLDEAEVTFSMKEGGKKKNRNRISPPEKRVHAAKCVGLLCGFRVGSGEAPPVLCFQIRIEKGGRLIFAARDLLFFSSLIAKRTRIERGRREGC
jgi:hypothetical protein